jgi:hypothetical protein
MAGVDGKRYLDPASGLHHSLPASVSYNTLAHHKASVGRRRRGACATASNVIHKLLFLIHKVLLTPKSNILNLKHTFAPLLICMTELSYYVGTGHNASLSPLYCDEMICRYCRTLFCSKLPHRSSCETVRNKLFGGLNYGIFTLT